MGLTFPWELCCLDAQCCCSQRWRLGGAGVSQRARFHAQPHCWYLTLASISPWSLYFKWKCKSLAICFTYGARVTGCLFERSSLFIWPAPTQLLLWICRYNSFCSDAHIFFCIGAASDEQDEFTMPFWTSHSQTPHGEPALTGALKFFFWFYYINVTIPHSRYNICIK